MPDQDALRAYFDVVVERIDVDDIMMQASVRDQPIRSRRPALAVVLAFVGAVVAIGGVLALALLTPLDGRRPGSTADEFRWIVDAPPTVGPTIGVLVAATAVAASAVVLLWVVVPVFRRRYQRRDEDMKTMEREVDSAVDSAVNDLRSQRRWLIVLVAFLTATTVGFGVWALSLAGEEDLTVIALDGDVTPRQQEMLDFIAEDGPWGTAWTTGTGEDMAALFTSNGYHAGMDGRIYRNSDGSLASILNLTGGTYPNIAHQIVVDNHVVLVVEDGGTSIAAFELTPTGPLEIISLIAAG